jgi:hypothetical protein
MASQWYYRQGDVCIGPVTSGELRRLAATGEITPRDLIRKQGMNNWVEAQTAKGLFAPIGPPPLRRTDPTPVTQQQPASRLEQPTHERRSVPFVDPSVFRLLVLLAPVIFVTTTWKACRQDGAEYRVYLDELEKLRRHAEHKGSMLGISQSAFSLDPSRQNEAALASDVRDFGIANSQVQEHLNRSPDKFKRLTKSIWAWVYIIGATAFLFVAYVLYNTVLRRSAAQPASTSSSDTKGDEEQRGGISFWVLLLYALAITFSFFGGLFLCFWSSFGTLVAAPLLGLGLTSTHLWLQRRQEEHLHYSWSRWTRMFVLNCAIFYSIMSWPLLVRPKPTERPEHHATIDSATTASPPAEVRPTASSTAPHTKPQDAVTARLGHWQRTGQHIFIDESRCVIIDGEKGVTVSAYSVDKSNADSLVVASSGLYPVKDTKRLLSTYVFSADRQQLKREGFDTLFGIAFDKAPSQAYSRVTTASLVATVYKFSVAMVPQCISHLTERRKEPIPSDELPRLEADALASLIVAVLSTVGGMDRNAIPDDFNSCVTVAANKALNEFLKQNTR